MAACTSCGTEAAGNFCAHCGAPAPARLHGTMDGPELLGASGPPVATSTIRVDRGSGRRRVLVVAALATVVAAGAVIGSRSSATEESAPSTPSPTTTTAPEPDIAPPPSSEAAAEAPDWHVVTQSATGIVRVDLATGLLEPIGVDGDLLGGAWDHVFIRRLNGDLTSIAIDDLAGDLPLEETLRTDGAHFSSDAWLLPGTEPGLAWIVSGFDEESWQIDVVTGEVQRNAPTKNPGWFQLSPLFYSPWSGGIYRLQDDGGYRLAMDGRIHGEGPGRILTSSCDPELNCEVNWRHARTLEPLDQFVLPDGMSAEWVPETTLQGRYVIGNSQEWIDTVTGEPFLARTEELDGAWNGTTAISPDGALVVHRSQLDGSLNWRRTTAYRFWPIEDLTLSSRLAPPVFVPRR